MPKLTQFDRHKKGDSQRAVSLKLVQRPLKKKKRGNWRSGGQKKKYQASSGWTVLLVDSSTVGPSLIRNGLHGRMAVKKPFLRKGNREKRLSYAKWHKKWTENQWKQVWWRDESSPEPGPQHYWSSVRSSWQRTEQKAADIQRRALGCPSRSLENYSCRLLKEMTGSLSKRVQAVLENKGAQSRYSLSSWSELYLQIWAHILYFISVYTFQ